MLYINTINTDRDVLGSLTISLNANLLSCLSSVHQYNQYRQRCKVLGGLTNANCLFFHPMKEHLNFELPKLQSKYFCRAA